MFHFYITLAYIIPNIYLFFRIMYLFIPKKYRYIYILIYVIVVIIYPVAERYSHREMNFFIQLLSTISGYILPFFLYMFLIVVVFDIFLLFNRFLGLVSAEKRKSYPFRFYALSAMILLSLIIVSYGVINLNTMRFSKYQVTIPKKKSETETLKIAFVSDIHIKQNTSIRYIEQFVRKVNSLQPDLLLFGGDIVEGDSENETTEAIERAFRSISTKYGLYGVLGNHEFFGNRQTDNFFRKAGIILLHDSVCKINNSIYLAGRIDERYRRRKNVNELLENIREDLPVIVVDHRPTELQEVSKTSADIQFSGHTHHGQLFPINLITNSVYELSWGYKKIRNTHFFVSSGLRLWGPPVKTAGKSEIILVEIRFE